MTLFARKEKTCQYLLGYPFNISPTPPNSTIFTRIDLLVFKFSISVFYTSILQGTTLSLPPILFVLQICEHCEGQIFMSNPPQAQRIIKSNLQFFTCLTLSLSLSYIFFQILVQNLFGIKILRVFLILLEGVPIFFFFLR